jgi:nucleotide-binding universal stress UspA family protein
MEKTIVTKGENAARSWNILVGIDGSEASDLALKRTGQAAMMANSRVEVMVLNVIEDAVHFDRIPPVALYQEKLKFAQDVINKAEKELKNQGIDCKTKIALGPIANEIIQVADEEEAECIFMGSRGLGGVKSLLLGSVAYNVMRKAHCSVAVVRWV